MKSEAHRRAPAQEKEMAARIGGKTTPASGARDMKGDVRLKSITRLECKTTTKKSFSVTRDMLKKIENASVGSGELPVFVVEFLDGNRPVGEFAIIPSYALSYLVNGIETS